MGNINIPNLTDPLEWQNQPTGWDWSEDHLTITSRARTDWFIDPGSGDTFHSAPALLFSVSAPCILRALVTVQHIATFDAGALVVFESPHSWDSASELVRVVGPSGFFVDALTLEQAAALLRMLR